MFRQERRQVCHAQKNNSQFEHASLAYWHFNVAKLLRYTLNIFHKVYQAAVFLPHGAAS